MMLHCFDSEEMCAFECPQELNQKVNKVERRMRKSFMCLCLETLNHFKILGEPTLSPSTLKYIGETENGGNHL